MKIIPLIAVFDNPTSIIPGHTIKEAAPPHTPIAIIPKGTTPVSIKSQREYAALFAASPDLLAVCQEIIEHGTDDWEARTVTLRAAIARLTAPI